jgi:hypothetical protein
VKNFCFCLVSINGNFLIFVISIFEGLKNSCYLHDNLSNQNEPLQTRAIDILIIKVLLFAKYLRREKKDWIPRIAIAEYLLGGALKTYPKTI